MSGSNIIDELMRGLGVTDKDAQEWADSNPEAKAFRDNISLIRLAYLNQVHGVSTLPFRSGGGGRNQAVLKDIKDLEEGDIAEIDNVYVAMLRRANTREACKECWKSPDRCECAEETETIEVTSREYIAGDNKEGKIVVSIPPWVNIILTPGKVYRLRGKVDNQGNFKLFRNGVIKEYGGEQETLKPAAKGNFALSAVDRKNIEKLKNIIGGWEAKDVSLSDIKTWRKSNAPNIPLEVLAKEVGVTHLLKKS